ncbi:hypothetical protein RRG08_062502 [Elysia crispata]|uniref:Uncharacterized protein n=1 Tax=Elysia crispata TaxID=231223 RepID=A0AAE0ZXZ0_9GAST|nr:hypothetical protein RRG08_062502 [Elysia crispata]
MHMIELATELHILLDPNSLMQERTKFGMTDQTEQLSGRDQWPVILRINYSGCPLLFARIQQSPESSFPLKNHK